MTGLRWAGCLAFLFSILVSHSAAQMFYATSEPGEQIDLVDFTAGTVTDIYDVGDRTDSVLVNAQGQLIYTATAMGTLQMFDPQTGQNTVLANFGAGGPRDLVFDPGGGSVLVALYVFSKIARYDLASGTTTIFPAKELGTSLDGLAYDPAGNLYAVVSRNTICQLDPNTGAILQTVVLEPHYETNGGDGLVYDTYTKNLWSAHDGTIGDGLIELPLTESTPPILGTPIFLQTGNIHVPDGVISDGQGNLYIGEGLQFLTQYSIPSDTIVKRLLVDGIDSEAFVPSPSSPGQFDIALTPPSGTALDNQEINYTLNITTSNNYAPTFQVSCTGLPSPAVCTTAGSVLAGSSQVQVQTESLAVGSYDFTVSVTDGVTTQYASAEALVGNFAATLASTSLTVEVGQSGTVGVNVTGLNGFSDPVTLSCSSPAETTCSLSPNSVTPSAAGTASTLTITVTSRPTGSARGVAAGGAAWIGLAMGMCFMAQTRRKVWKRLGLDGLLLLGLLIFAVSCGGGSSSEGSNPGTGGGVSNPTTFTVTVQATSDSVVQSAGTVTVTVP
jgi:hypothetical protein